MAKPPVIVPIVLPRFAKTATSSTRVILLRQKPLIPEHLSSSLQNLEPVVVGGELPLGQRPSRSYSRIQR